jgi:hypothetical protein
MQLAAAGTLITLGGTGQADAGWAQKPDWNMHARKLTDTAMRAVTAAHGKNLAAFCWTCRRAMLAILENFQDADRSIAVPTALWEFGAPHKLGGGQA